MLGAFGIGTTVGKGGRIKKKVEETYGARVRCYDLRERKRMGVVWAMSDAKDKDASIAAIQHIQRAAGVAGTLWKDTLETVWH